MSALVLWMLAASGVVPVSVDAKNELPFEWPAYVARSDFDLGFQYCEKTVDRNAAIANAKSAARYLGGGTNFEYLNNYDVNNDGICEYFVRASLTANRRQTPNIFVLRTSPEEPLSQPLGILPGMDFQFHAPENGHFQISTANKRYGYASRIYTFNAGHYTESHISDIPPKIEVIEGELAFRENKLEEARIRFANAFNRERKNFQAVANLALVYSRLGSLADARPLVQLLQLASTGEFQHAVSERTRSGAYFNLGKLYENQGALALAHSYYSLADRLLSTKGRRTAVARTTASAEDWENPSLPAFSTVDVEVYTRSARKEFRLLGKHKDLQIQVSAANDQGLWIGTNRGLLHQASAEGKWYFLDELSRLLMTDIRELEAGPLLAIRAWLNVDGTRASKSFFLDPRRGNWISFDGEKGYFDKGFWKDDQFWYVNHAGIGFINPINNNKWFLPREKLDIEGSPAWGGGGAHGSTVWFGLRYVRHDREVDTNGGGLLVLDMKKQSARLLRVGEGIMSNNVGDVIASESSLAVFHPYSHHINPAGVSILHRQQNHWDRKHTQDSNGVFHADEIAMNHLGVWLLHDEKGLCYLRPTALRCEAITMHGNKAAGLIGQQDVLYYGEMVVQPPFDLQGQPAPVVVQSSVIQIEMSE